MTTPSFFQEKGLSIRYGDPLIKSGRTIYLGTLSRQVNSYSHESRAIGGYWSANIDINDKQAKIEDWTQYGLGRHIEVYNEALELIWEGFVNQVDAKLGVLDYSAGPLIGDEMANRIKASYSTADNSTVPPTVGIRATTATANNTDSQTIYGIIERVLSLSGATATEAAQARDTFLAERAWPPISRNSSLEGSGPSVRLSCLGYWHWLTAYIYNLATTGDINLSAKIQAVLAANPNNIFSTDYTEITTNTTQVSQHEDEDRTAETILTKLVSVGDASFNRYIIGFYGGRKLFYQATPSEIEYKQRLTGNQGVTNNLGKVVNPWNVRPGKWLLYGDFLVGQLPPISVSSLRTDQRASFIETVSFSTPNTLSISGKRVGQLDQLLARLGMGGLAG